MYIHKNMHSFVSTHEKKRKIFVAFQTAHGGRFNVLCTATRLLLSVLADCVNGEFKNLVPKDEHSLHSPNSFYSLGYLFTSQYIIKPNNSVSQLLLYLQGCAFVLGILTALRQENGRPKQDNHTVQCKVIVYHRPGIWIHCCAEEAKKTFLY